MSWVILLGIMSIIIYPFYACLRMLYEDEKRRFNPGVAAIVVKTKSKSNEPLTFMYRLPSKDQCNHSLTQSDSYHNNHINL